MKKLLLSIFGIFFGLISFSSAESYYGNSFSCYIGTPINGYNECNDDVLLFGNGNDVTTGTYIFNVSVPDGLTFEYDLIFWPYIGGITSSFRLSSPISFIFSCSDLFPCREINPYNYNRSNGEGLVTYSVFSYSQGGGSSSDITVFYDYGHSSTSVACNGDNSIFINGMANLSNQTTFTPFFNISYVDEDNQNLIESYSKDMLYLANGQFKKTYTGDNQWILTVQNQGGSTPDIIFTGETLPVVVTGDSDNVFSNFGDNALMLISSNIPGIITWGFILFIILFIIRLFIPKNRR